MYYAYGPNVYFVSNVDIDGADVRNVLKKLNQETTLFIVAFKTFTTIETITNALTAREWVKNKLGNGAVAKHFIAISTNVKKVQDFEILLDIDILFSLQ